MKRSVFACVLVLVTAAGMMTAQVSEQTVQTLRVEDPTDPTRSIRLQPPTGITSYALTWPASLPAGTWSFVINGTTGTMSWVDPTTLSPIEIASVGNQNLRRVASQNNVTPAGIGQFANDFSGSRASAGRTATGQYSAILGGNSNLASGQYSLIGGGQNNTASGISSFVVGGASNTASGNYSGVLGGQNLTLAGDNTVGYNGGSAMTVAAANTVVFANNNMWLANNNNAASELRFYEPMNTPGVFPQPTTNYAAFKAASSMANDNVYTLPAAVGNANEVLTIDTKSGNNATTKWASVATILAVTGYPSGQANVPAATDIVTLDAAQYSAFYIQSDNGGGGDDDFLNVINPTPGQVIYVYWSNDTQNDVVIAGIPFNVPNASDVGVTLIYLNGGWRCVGSFVQP